MLFFLFFFQAGILSIRTFSVMVIMCLFTTFITSPLVNLIYPKQFRVLLDSASVNASSSAHPTLPKRKSATGTDKKGETTGEHEDADVFVGENPENRAKNVEMLAKKSKLAQRAAARVPTVSRVGVVVDTLPQQSLLLPLLHLLAPRGASSNTSSSVSSVQPFHAGTKATSTATSASASASVMAVTAMHFIEPKATLEDEFLALNKDGQLIRIDEEATDVLAALRDLHDPTVKTKPALLPLSMFCRALSASVNAFRVQGDPHAFPQVTLQSS